MAVHDDRTHFEFLVLEGAQAGLSWLTILKRRHDYRRVFADFDPAKVARITPARLESILADASIILTMLPTGAVVRAVLTEGGEASLAAALRPGSIVIDTTSSEPLSTP